MRNETGRLCLGTAQFGSDYGIANKRGMVPRNEVFDILRRAEEKGVRVLDTAHGYGESENVIGRFFEESGAGFGVISKLPRIHSGETAGEYVLESLKRLKRGSIYGYLLHSFDDYSQNKRVYGELEDLKQKGVIKKTGFSIYNPRELETLFNDKTAFDIIQFPYSVFDRRFEPYFPELKKNGVEIYARSVFLQGLAFMEPDKLKGAPAGAGRQITRLREISALAGMSIYDICLRFVLANGSIDKIVVGVDDIGQLEKNIVVFSGSGDFSGLEQEVDHLVIRNEDILLPYRWNR
ncbi:MAG: aldo/keto reductase [Candidatus Omnitrophota bacterium]